MTDQFDKPLSIVEPAKQIRLADFIGRRCVTAHDAEAIRRGGFPLGLKTFDEAQALFDIEADRSEKSREWSELFIELVSDFVIWGERPTGVVNSERAEWLLAQVDRARTANGLLLLVAIVDEAHLVPSWFIGAVRERSMNAFRTVESKPAAMAAA